MDFSLHEFALMYIYTVIFLILDVLHIVCLSLIIWNLYFAFLFNVCFNEIGILFLY